MAIGYDDLGRRTYTTRGSSQSAYGYDPASRLTSLAQNFAGGTGSGSATLGYNAAAQVTSRAQGSDDYTWTGAVSASRGYGVNGLNQYTQSGSVALGYDGRGNLRASI